MGKLSGVGTLAAIMGCSILGLAVPSQALMLVSRDQEVRIGKQVQAEVIDDYGGLSYDKTQSERVKRIGAQIAALSPRQNVTYTYQLLNSYEINAFSAPGGPVFITQRLARMMTTDDELAFVLGHETGHIAAQHAREMINRTMIAQGLATILFGGASSGIQLGVSLTYTLYDRGYSRNAEYQADDYGVQLMKQAGYNPEGAVRALAKLGMDSSRGLNKYLATHPDIPRRIDRVGRIAGISTGRQQELIKEAQAEVAAK